MWFQRNAKQCVALPLFAKDSFDVPHFPLNRAAYFFGGATIPQAGIGCGLAGFLFYGALGLMGGSFDLIPGARLHVTES